MGYTLVDQETPSSIFKGTASKQYSEEFLRSSGVPASNHESTKKSYWFEDLKKSVGLAVKNTVGFVSKGFSNTVNWFKSIEWKFDPKVFAAVVVGGVLLVVGAKVVAVVGGLGLGAIRLLWSVPYVGKFLATGLIGVTIGSVIRWVVRGASFLWNFNWNITDKQIREQQQSLIQGLYGIAGATIGSGLATLVCGAAPVAIASRTNFIKTNPMALAKLKEISEVHPESGGVGELWEEFYENMKLLIGASGRAVAQIAFIESYKNLRKIIKDSAKLANLKSVFPWLGKTVEQWGEEGSQAWSFASAVENWIETISDTKIKAFTEEFVENFLDTCQESLMIVSYAL